MLEMQRIFTKQKKVHIFFARSMCARLGIYTHIRQFLQA